MTPGFDENKEDAYKHVERTLRGLDQKSLIVIDNAWEPEQVEIWEKLAQALYPNLYLLVTTRREARLTCT